MSTPVLTFFNNKGGVGKTSLVYHLAWMLSNEGRRVLACDLDPQANLTASFIEEGTLEELWSLNGEHQNSTVFDCVSPLAEIGDLRDPRLKVISQSLRMIPGDLSLSGFEEVLSGEWTKALDTENLYRPFRILTAFWQVMQKGAREMNADIILVDVGRPGVADYRNPNLAEAMRKSGLGYVQRFGAGIGTAQRLLREADHPVAK